MFNRKSLIGVLAVGLMAAAVAPMTQATAATKTTKKAAKTTKARTTTKTTARATTPSTSAAPATTPATTATATTAAGGKSGGSAVFGIDAECNSWLHGPGQWGAACGVVAGSVYDRWMALGGDGAPIPNLLTSATPSADYKTWTFTVRSGIKFHNGETLDGAAFVANMDHARTGSATGPLFTNLVGCTASGQQATCTTRVPWVSFPGYLTGQSGAAIAPAQIRANDGRHLIGTGAFMCRGDCWVPNQKTTLVKNPDYWRKGLPKLDSIEFRPIPDEDQRLAQLQSGQVQFLQTNNYLTGRDLAALAKDKKAELLTNELSGAVSYDIVNMARPGPMQDVRVRRAWAHAIDLDTLIRLRAPGATAANGPFSAGALGYLPDSGYPKHDPDKAKALLDEYKREKNISGGVRVSYGSTAVADNQQTMAVMKQMLDRAGFDIQILPGLEQTAYIGAVFTGQFEVMQWTWLPYSDPDIFRAFLSSDGCGGPAVCPRTIGAQVLNWGRVTDGIVDSSFDQIRSNSDPSVRKRAAESVSAAFGENAYILWRWRSRLHIASCAKCGGIFDSVGADGEKVASGAASHFVGTPWLTVG